MKIKIKFRTVLFGDKPINNLDMLMILTLLLVPFLRWAVYSFGVWHVLRDIYEHYIIWRKKQCIIWRKKQ